MIVFYFIIILILFYILNSFFLKKKLEYFDRLKDGLVCGTKGNICGEGPNGINSCCKGLKCIRPNGDYLNRICVNNDKNNLFDGIIPINISNSSNSNINTNSESAKNLFDNAIADLEGGFSKFGSFFSGLSINLGDSCKK